MAPHARTGNPSHPVVLQLRDVHPRKQLPVERFGRDGVEGNRFEPVGIVVGPDGRVYVADSGNGRISVFQRDGTPIAQWPVAAWAGQGYFEPYLAVDNNGLLYATSSATGSVEVYDLDGNFVTSLTSAGAEQFQRPIGITQGANGQMMVTDAGLNAVLQFAPIAPPVVACSVAALPSLLSRVQLP